VRTATKLFFIVCLCALAGRWPLRAQTNLAVLINDGAWTWFNDPRAIFHNGILYFGYVRASDGHGALSTFNLQSGLASNLWISSRIQTDDHDNPGLLAKQDGTMLATYSRHQSDQFFCSRLSTGTNPAAPSNWGPEQTNNPGTIVGSGMTYANPFELAAENGKIYDFGRYLNYNPNVFTSTDGGATWSAPTLLVQTGTGSTRPYVKYCSDGRSRIDVLYTDAHPDNQPTSLYHIFYQSNGIYKSDGTFLKSFANLPLLHDSGETGSVIYQHNETPQTDPNQWIPFGRAWCWEIAYQSNGPPACVFQAKVDNVTGTFWSDARIYYYYARWTGTNWQKRFIAQAGRPLYNGQPDYGGGIALDPQDVNTVYLSSDAANPFDLSSTTNVPLSSHYELWKGVTTDGGLNFTWKAATANSTMDNLRPYVPRRFGGEPCVLWFRGNYSSYTSFSTSIVGLFTTQVPTNGSRASAKITYVDAAATNTVLAGSGAAFNPTSDRSGTDGLWCLRAYGNNGTVFEAGGDTSSIGNAAGGNNEDAARLVTTIRGLAPGAWYNVYAYFWGTSTSGQDWRLRAGLTNAAGALPSFSYLVQPTAQATDFALAPLVNESDRVLKQAALGMGVADSVGAIPVYVDDDPGARSGIADGWMYRTWYDGVGYSLAPDSNAPALAFALNGSALTLCWSASHLGWILQAQTNGLAASWHDLQGTDGRNSCVVNLDAANEAVFYRLQYQQ
jgi:hypothetical protein